jgi:hypothetical protein
MNRWLARERLSGTGNHLPDIAKLGLAAFKTELLLALISNFDSTISRICDIHMYFDYSQEK